MRAKVGLPPAPLRSQAAQQLSSKGDSNAIDDEVMHMLRGMGARMQRAQQQQQQQRAGEGEGPLQGSSALSSSGALVAEARARLASMEPEEVTLGELHIILQDYLHIARSRSGEALCAAPADARPRTARQLVDAMMGGMSTPSPMTLAHLARPDVETGRIEHVLRMGEVPSLLAEYRAAVALHSPSVQ